MPRPRRAILTGHHRHFGAEEYYVLNPDTNTLVGFTRSGRKFIPIKKIGGFVSPRLGIRFDTSGPEVRLFNPDGTPFLSFVELGERAAAEKARADAAEKRIATESARADAEAAARAELIAKLRKLGLDPDNL